ncbi:unnamed protein product [Candidula unifasciata]|uniref:Thioredoxin domain-containing protein n=1 Tax=Candidula unifasciata TaxID=100452 RepID=A0A8S4A8W0_9EUPU|nr:unnamed protein product [Candidula unifasciata]
MDRFLFTSLTRCCRYCFHTLCRNYNSHAVLGSVARSKHQVTHHLQPSVFSSPAGLPPVRISLRRRFATQSDNTGQKVEPGVVNIPFWGRLLIVSGIGGIVYYIYHNAQQIKELEKEEYRYKELKKVQLGGDWTLTDHNGNKRSSTDFRGQWVVMYMGFTHCPDICPEEMEKLSKIIENFDNDPQQPNLQPVFITLDPERDSPTVIKDYLKDFKPPRIVGFTGSDDEIREVAKKYRAYYGKGERNSDNDYIVDHTIITYLISPKGDFVNYYDRSRTAEQVTESIKRHIHKYNEIERRRQ